MKTAAVLMIQGTASSVGKSLLVAGLCRLFRRAGLRVAPFKAQNMALNSAVAADGGEVGRAQAVQAEAAGVEPTVDMNPILLKPEGDARSQVIVLGRPTERMSAAEYHARKPELRAIVRASLERLRAAADLVIIEGAGSPAEVNLKDRDIVNMDVAKAAGARVLLVGDIDRGGVFAAFVGTLELLEPEERALVGAFVVNKFRGDVRLLEPGLDFLRQRTGVPVAGVIPYLRGLRIADEDSVALERRRGVRRAAPGELEVAIVRLPHLSNYDEFDALEHEPGVVVRYVEQADELRGADLVVLPGSKRTVADLDWARERGIADELVVRGARGEPILGVCAGCQMLGESLLDPDRVECDRPHTPGLGLLPLVTRFRREKTTTRVRVRVEATMLAPAGTTEARGYEIHMGEVERTSGEPAVRILSRNGVDSWRGDGAVSEAGTVVGTTVHGLLENDAVRAELLHRLRARRGLAAPVGTRVPSREEEYDRLADALAASLDRDLVFSLAGIAPPGIVSRR
jgi:adenosylcobyric acid synthase